MRYIIIVLLIIPLFSLGQTIEITSIITNDYELIISNKQKGLLVLFPCFPCDAENTKAEFNIVDIAVNNGISLLLLNFNRHLYLSDYEKSELTTLMLKTVIDNQLNKDNIFIGGFSSGGNVALLLGNYLIKTHHEIQPKGVFIVDSPIDLIALYENANKTVERNFSVVAVKEARWIINLLESEFGDPDTGYKNYEKYSPYISKTNATQNISELKSIKVRMYTEPDATWWKENRQRDYENTNAYYIKKLAEGIQRMGANKAEYIPTENRGYRANGDRHPHSWSIVDEKQLIDWILEK